MRTAIPLAADDLPWICDCRLGPGCSLIPGLGSSSDVILAGATVLSAVQATGAKAARWKQAYIEAFNAMETQLRGKTAPLAALNDPVTMRNLLLSYSEKAIALQEQVDELKPAAEPLDRIAVADGSLNVTNAAKTLQVQPRILFNYLRTKGWIYKRPGTNLDVGYQAKIEADLLEHKIHTVIRPDGSELVTTQVRVTPKGLARLAKELKD